MQNKVVGQSETPSPCREIVANRSIQIKLESICDEITIRKKKLS